MNLTGPAEGWFGFGFDAARMSDEPYTLIVEPGSEHKVTEWKLGTHNRGKDLGQAHEAMWFAGDKVWAEDACPTAGAQAVGNTPYYYSPDARAQVQCCGDGPIPGSGRRKEKVGTKNQWVEWRTCTRKANSTCLSPGSLEGVTYADAKGICAGAGLRLCTKAESLA